MAQTTRGYTTFNFPVLNFRSWMLCLAKFFRKLTSLMKTGAISQVAKYACATLLMATVMFLLMTTVVTDYIVVEEAENETKVETYNVKSSVTNPNSVTSSKLSNGKSSSRLSEDITTSYEMTSTEKTQLAQKNSNLFTNNKVTQHMLTHDVLSCLRSFPEDLSEPTPFDNDAYTKFRRDLLKFNILSFFNKIVMSLNIKVVIMEPSALHCMLLPSYKKQLERRKFNISYFLGARNVFTYGIGSQDVLKLQEEQSIYKLRAAGFHPYFVQKPTANWMNETSNAGKPSNMSEAYTPHVFYAWHDFTIHLVVLHSRNEYIWHDELGNEDNLNVPNKENLLFVNHPSAYEKFTFVSMADKSEILSNFYVPSNPHHFLHQLQSSRFLECNATRAKDVSYPTNLPKSHSSLSVYRFNKQFLVALRQLKALLHPLLMNFWIFSGTMLGWYRECNIIPYTTDVDFAAWVSDLDFKDLEYIKTRLLENKNLTLRERMGVLEQALEFRLDSDGLRVDLFFLYQIKNGSWASGHRPSRGYFFKYYYPNFTLCSAELMGEKVHVPCETEKVILSEYGPNWMKPVSSWNYEASIFNRGPNIYWSKEERENADHDY